MSARFKVEKTTVEMSYGDAPQRELKAVSEADEENELLDGASSQEPGSSSAPAGTEKSDGTESEDSDDGHVFSDDYATRERVSSLISRLAQYRSPVHESTSDLEQGADKDGENHRPRQTAAAEKTRKVSRQTEREHDKFGTIIGVYLPCVQNIFGVILLLRFAWLVGTSGIIESMVLILVCTICMLLTALSLSAIATNGIVPSGGAYVILTRSFGAELGGVVGLLHYFCGILIASIYCLGASELLVRFMMPQATIFNEEQPPASILTYSEVVSRDLLSLGCSAPPLATLTSSMTTPNTALNSTIYNNYRVYGVCCLVFLFCCVFLGVKLINRLTFVALGCIILVILSAFLGLLIHSGPDSQRSQTYCAIGDLLYVRGSWTWRCTAQNRTVELCVTTDRNESFLRALHCNSTNGLCDSIYSKNTVLGATIALPGASVATIIGNSQPKHNLATQQPAVGQVVSDLQTDWNVVLGILFNAFTGFLVGPNRSGQLRDAHHSIPLGMIAAVGTTSGIYVLLAALLCAVVPSILLRDKFGDSLGRTLMLAEVAWPHKLVVLIAGFIYLLTAALMQLDSAPRLLATVARDGVMPMLERFSATSKRGVPVRALLLTVLFVGICIVVASLDRLAIFCTVMTLATYMFINVACLLQTVLRTPNWRPRFKYYHWTAALLGCLLCAVIMFLVCWYYAVIVLFVACGLYKYIEYKGAEKEWGDGLTGLAMSAARYALLRLEHSPPLIKNWRPQILYVTRCTDELQPLYPRTFDFLSQLKAGRGLTLLVGLLEGSLPDRVHDVQMCKQSLYRLAEQKRIKGLCDVLVAENAVDGVRHAVQIAGLGGLKHNTVVVDWPYDWKAEVEKGASASSSTSPTSTTAPNLSSNSNVQRAALGDAPVGSLRPAFNPHESALNASPARTSTQTSEQPSGLSWRLFVESVRTAKAAGCALLVPKDVSRFPANNEVLERGTIDVWWIVHDGGLLLLLPFLLMQNRVWRNCRLRIFTVAEIHDNSVQMKRDLKNALYHLRIHADFEVVEMGDSEISAYTYERTLCMEQRGQFLRGLRLDEGEKLALVQSFMDKAHETAAKGHHSKEKKLPPIQEDKVLPAGARPINPDKNQYTFSAPRENSFRHHRLPLRKNVRKMHTAVRLNQFIVQKSANARLVILNMPTTPRDTRNDMHFMTYLDVLTENLPRVLLVNGTGKEFITVYG